MRLRDKAKLSSCELRYSYWVSLLTLMMVVVSGCGPLLKDESEGELPAEISDRSILPEPVAPDEPVVVIEPPPSPRPKPAPRYILEGRLDLTADNVNILEGSSMNHAVVYFEPHIKAAKGQPGQYEVRAVEKLFTPAVLVIPVGSEVAFLNQDEILHNVFSVSSAAEFDLGFYGQGESRSYTFYQPGRVQVNCSVHHSMSVDILVLDTAFFAQPDDQGNFIIGNLPAGDGDLKIWHPQAAIDSYTLSIPVVDEQAFALKLTKPRVPFTNE